MLKIAVLHLRSCLCGGDKGLIGPGNRILERPPSPASSVIHREELALDELCTGRVPVGCVQVWRDPHTDTTTFALDFQHAAVVESCVLHSFQLGAMPEDVMEANCW